FGVANTWYFRQVGDISTDRSDYYFRAVDVEFTPRPLYRALARLGNELRYARPGIHSDLDASIRPIGTWTIIRDPDALNGELISGETGNRLSVSFEGNHVTGLLAPDQKATTITVSNEAGDNREILIAAGERRIEFGEWSADQAVQKRTVEIEVTGDAPLLLDGIEVQEHRSSRTLIVGSVLFALSAGILLVFRRGASA
ncbi:MAG: hypothetical protein R3E12_00010, partial [Candidatus Eisenbacteria bacterium]